MAGVIYPEELPGSAQFQERVTAARRLAGYTQSELAQELGLHDRVLSRKLHRNHDARLNHQEVKRIILTLVNWEGITSYAEVQELLALADMKPENFSPYEWTIPPLSQLQEVPPYLKRVVTGAVLPVYSSLVPKPTTSFIERTQLENQICAQLRQPDIRLLTLLGTGGVGKTRLSLQIAELLTKDFPDGISFIALDSVQDHRLVSSAIAQNFGLADRNVEASAGDMRLPYEERLKGFLKTRHMLLILDNFEHILEAAPFIGRLLEAAAHLKILVTSRSVLRLYGERQITVQPLEVYGPEHLKDPGQLRKSPAIRLFIARAQEANPNFKLAKSDLTTLAGLCSHLDGLPLAIELVAARSKQFSLKTLAKRLEQEDAEGEERTLAFLSQRKSNIPDRHQTLERTLDWSYALLEPQIQRIFAYLGIFLGGWTPEAAQAVCSPKQDGLDGEMLLEQMEELISQSMVVADEEELQPEGAYFSRFRLLEVIRRYALERLNVSGEREEAERRHAFYYLSLAERTEPDLLSDRRQLAIQMLARDRDNFRAALQWAISHGEAELAQRLCSILELYWEALSQLQEAHRWMDAALAMPQPTPTRVKAKLYLAISWLYLWEISCEKSRQLSEKALELSTLCEDVDGQAKAIFQIGETYHFQGENHQALVYFEKSLRMEQELGNERESAFAFGRLGAIALLQGNLSRAELFLKESNTTLRELNEFARLGAGLGVLGIVYIFQGDFDRAVPTLQEAMLLSAEVGPPYTLGLNWTILGCALGGAVAPAYAARICSAASALFARLGTALPTSYLPLYESYTGMVRSGVEDEIWEDWWQEGQQLSELQTIDLALEGCQIFASKQGMDQHI